MQLEQQWVKVSIEVTATLVDLPAAILWNAGASGVEIQDRTTLVEGRAPLPKDNSRAVAFFGGETPKSLRKRILNDAKMWGLTIKGITVEVFTDVSWKEKWKQFFKPSIVSRRLAVRPPWENFPVPEGVEILVIEPGLAFGTGTHATTRLCLKWLDDLCAELPSGAQMLDVGCGSGILSIAAALLEPDLKINALDVDPEALRVCRENIAVNRVGGRVNLLGPLLSDFQGQCDLVVANILSHILVRLADDLTRCTETCDGRLMLSGIGRDDVDAVTKAFGERGMNEIERRTEDGWVALLMVHDQPRGGT